MKKKLSVVILLLLSSFLFADIIKMLPINTSKSDIMDYYMDCGYSVSKHENRIMIDPKGADFLNVPCISLSYLMDREDKAKVVSGIYMGFDYKTLYESILMTIWAFNCDITEVSLESNFHVFAYSNTDKVYYCWNKADRKDVDVYIFTMVEDLDYFKK